MNAYHEQITELFDEYYRDKTTVKRRIANASGLIEEFIDKHGKRPPASVCSRLATYILLDTLTDSHPDKMTREEYPIMSDNQAELRQRREHSISDVYTGMGDETIGRYTDDDGVKRRIYDYMTPKKDNALVPLKYLDLYRAIDSAGLTDRQRQAIELVYFEGMTQEDAGGIMGVSQQAVDRYLQFSYEKIRSLVVK